LSNDDGEQRDDDSERDEKVEHILLRLIAAPLDEAHVVHEHNVSRRRRHGADWIAHRVHARRWRREGAERMYGDQE
jgi:hypothetical protein